MTRPMTAISFGPAPAALARAEWTPHLLARSGFTSPVLPASVPAQTGMRGTLAEICADDTETVRVAAGAAESNRMQS